MTTMRTTGLANLRDAGAVAGRPGVLYRSDAPVPDDPPPALEPWPPRTVLDLREDGERGPEPHPLAGAGTSVVTLPVASFLDPGAQARLRAQQVTLAELYELLLARGARWLPSLVRTAARGDGPLLIHCAAGKDRTGVAVALLLRAAGVPREDVVADYLRTNTVLDALRERLRRIGPAGDVPEHLLTVRLDAIDPLLDTVGDDVDGFLRERGADPENLRRWRARLA